MKKLFTFIIIGLCVGTTYGGGRTSQAPARKQRLSTGINIEVAINSKVSSATAQGQYDRISETTTTLKTEADQEILDRITGDEALAISTTALNNIKVNKSGDTMTGTLTISSNCLITGKFSGTEVKVNTITDGINKFTPENITVVTKTIYIDGNRTDFYTENGSIIKPFKSFINLLASGVPAGATVKVAPGYYTEDVNLTGLGEVTIIGDNTKSGDGTRIQGTVVVSGTNTKVSLKGIRIQPITDKIALDYVDGSNCCFQDCVFRNHTVGATSPLIRIGDVASGGGLGVNTPRFYNCDVYKDAGNIVIEGSTLTVVAFIGGHLNADISMIGIYGVLLDNVSGCSDITHNVSVLGIYRSQIGSLTSAVTATPLNAFIALNQITLRTNDGVTVGAINLNGTCPYVMGICDYNIVTSNFGAGIRLYNSFDRDLKNTSSVIGATVRNAIETLDTDKFNVSGGTLVGNLDMSGNKISNLKLLEVSSITVGGQIVLNDGTVITSTSTLGGGTAFIYITESDEGVAISSHMAISGNVNLNNNNIYGVNKGTFNEIWVSTLSGNSPLYINAETTLGKDININSNDIDGVRKITISSMVVGGYIVRQTGDWLEINLEESGESGLGSPDVLFLVSNIDTTDTPSITIQGNDDDIYCEGSGNTEFLFYNFANLRPAIGIPDLGTPSFKFGNLYLNYGVNASTGTFYSVDVSTINNLNYIKWNTGVFTVGVDTPTATGIEFMDSNFDKWVSTGTSNASDWKQLSQ